jgi:hypothetical protein
MSRLFAAMATLACMIGFTAPAPPAAADTDAAGDPAVGWSVSLTFPDLQWSSESCQFVPVTAVVTGSGVERWTFGGFATRRDDDGEGANWYIDYDTKVSDGTGTFTFRHAVMLCPWYDGSGGYDVVGEVGVLLTGAADWSWLPYRAAFTVSGIPTTTTLDTIAVAGARLVDDVPGLQGRGGHDPGPDGHRVGRRGVRGGQPGRHVRHHRPHLPADWDAVPRQPQPW